MTTVLSVLSFVIIIAYLMTFINKLKLVKSETYLKKMLFLVWRYHMRVLPTGGRVAVAYHEIIKVRD